MRTIFCRVFAILCKVFFLLYGPLEALQYLTFGGNISMIVFMIPFLLLGSVVEGKIGILIRDIEPQRPHDIASSLRQNQAIKTIQSEDGDIIDCVDIHKQPALNHPHLKNHSIQMRPSFDLREPKNNSASESWEVKQIWQKSGSCPVGTIPIMRNRVEGLSKSLPLPAYAYGRQVSNNGHLEATLASCQGAPYYGARSEFNVWSMQVEPNEYSLSFLGIFKVDNEDGVMAGWGVYPILFGDNQTRFFIYWTGADGRGCYNLECSGFVQVNNNVYIGGPSLPDSSYNGDQYFFGVSIIKDDSQSSWWLQAYGEMVGYWPLSIFSDFQVASLLFWEGAVYNSNITGHHTSTQLGSGHFANEGYKKAAFIDGMQAMDSSNNFVTPPGIRYVATNPNCYSISWPALLVKPGASFYYGGPGGGDSGCA